MDATGHSGSRGNLASRLLLLCRCDALPSGTILAVKLHMSIKAAMVGKTQSEQKPGIEEDRGSNGGVARHVGDTVGVSSLLWSALTSSALAL